MDKLVSIIIPTFDRSDMLSRAIDSARNQTYKNVEIIVVDDNGLGTLNQLATQKIAKEYSDVVYYAHKTNQGGSAARNTGWKNSHGDYISFLDDDDEMLPEKIESQVKCLEELGNSWGASYCAYKIMNENGYIQKSTTTVSGDVYIRALMRTMYICAGSNLLVRRNVIEEVKGFDESFSRNQDLEFLVRICEHYKLAYVEKELLVIHIEGKRKSHTFEELDEVAKYYLHKFDSRIQQLDQHDKERVLTVITLDRARVALKKKKVLCAIRILRQNKIRIGYLIKYAFYMVKRIIKKESYGFYIE